MHMSAIWAELLMLLHKVIVKSSSSSIWNDKTLLLSLKRMCCLMCCRVQGVLTSAAPKIARATWRKLGISSHSQHTMRSFD